MRGILFRVTSPPRPPTSFAPIPSPSSESTSTAVRGVRSRAGFSERGPWSVVAVTGPDAETFLQTQLPLDMARLAVGRGGITARLERRGRVRFLLVLLRVESGFLALVRSELAAAFLEDLERFHITERVETVVRDTVVMELHGPEVPEALARLTDDRAGFEMLHHRPVSILTAEGRRPARFVPHAWTGDVGGHLLVKPEDAPGVAAVVLEDEAVAPVDDDALELLRVEGGWLREGVDLDEKTLLPELPGYEAMVAFDKGCYLGQETVARVYSRGRINRVLVTVMVEGDRIPDPGTGLVVEGVPVGAIRNAVWSPGMERVIGTASVRRVNAEPGTVLHARVPGAMTAAQVVEPPPYRRPGPAERAEQLYREGMDRFRRDAFEEAITLFERATLMNPAHHAAMESIGVCQERLGRLDDAVETMTGLADMDPENSMVWTNLSRYYGKQGKIQEAEDAKGKALYLSWKKQAGEQAVKKRAEVDEAARKEALEKRIGLFEQVLELDPEDVVANFGLGKIHLDLGDFEAAVPRFREAIRRQGDYSMAYNHLGTSLLALDRREEAVKVFREGIAVAAKRGDLMPMRDMERKLAGIEGEGG